METTEPYVQPDAEPGIVLTFEAQTYLAEAGKWASFLGIVGFIGCGILLLVAFFAGNIFSRMAEISPSPMAVGFAGMGGFITVFYVLIDVLYFFFVLYLYQFGNQIKKGIFFKDAAQVTGALGKLKSFFKLGAITTIIFLCLYALLIIAVVIIGVGTAALMHR